MIENKTEIERIEEIAIKYFKDKAPFETIKLYWNKDLLNIALWGVTTIIDGKIEKIFFDKKLSPEEKYDLIDVIQQDANKIRDIVDEYLNKKHELEAKEANKEVNINTLNSNMSTTEDIIDANKVD
jgi:hypothetical protein